MSQQRDYSDLIRRAVERGWILEERRKHLKLTHPVSGSLVFAAKTPSDVRCVDNMRLQLLRAERAAGAAMPRRQAERAGETPGTKQHDTHAGGVARQVELLLRDLPQAPAAPPRMATQEDVIAAIQAFAHQLGLGTVQFLKQKGR